MAQVGQPSRVAGHPLPILIVLSTSTGELRDIGDAYAITREWYDWKEQWRGGIQMGSHCFWFCHCYHLDL